MAASAMVANLSGLSEKKKSVRSGEQEPLETGRVCYAVILDCSFM